MRLPRDLRFLHHRRHTIASGLLALGVAVATFVALGVLGLHPGAAERAHASGADDLALAEAPLPEVAAPVEAEAVSSLPAAFEPTGPVESADIFPDIVISQGVLARGESLVGSLQRLGVAPPAVNLVVRELSPHFDFRRAQPGHSYRLAQTRDGAVVAFRYNTSPTESYQMRLEGGEYTVRRSEAELVPQIAQIAGVVDTSLYGAVRDLGEDPMLATDFTDIFAWDVDFTRSVHRGDEFRIVYERLHRTDDDGNEVYVRPGRILAAHYGGATGEFTAVYFEPLEGRGGYYQPDGESVQGPFLLAPLRYSRISSRYTSARRHPILKITRPHHGIDYVASEGTPVWSVADGEVIYRGRAGGFGNLVKVRHVSGLVSYYSHLSRFSPDAKLGDTVQQKQVIGYVGQTGLATGPHICFRIAKNGHFVNPAKLRPPVGAPVPPEAEERFRAERDALLVRLDLNPLVATQEAL